MGRKKEEHDTALVKSYISTALLLLMEQHDYQDITITDIAKKAGVSRMTYYRTYSSKEDILVQYFDDIASNFLTEIKSRPGITLYQLAVQFFTFFHEYGNLIPTLRKANLLDLVFHNFIDNLRSFYADLLGRQTLNAAENYHLYFNAGGLSVALVLWSENGYKETPEELAQTIVPFMTVSENMHISSSDEPLLFHDLTGGSHEL